MHLISADHHTKEDGTKEGLSILQDNLDDQVQKKPRYVSGGIQHPLLVLPSWVHIWLGSCWIRWRKSDQVLVWSLPWWLALGLWQCGEMLFVTIHCFPLTNIDQLPSNQVIDTCFFTAQLSWEIFHQDGVRYVCYWIRRTLVFFTGVLFRWLFICLCFLW